MMDDRTNGRTRGSQIPETSHENDEAVRYLDQFIPFHLYRASACASAMALADYAPLGLTVPEARLLMVLLMSDEKSPSALSAIISVQRSLLSHMMRHLTTKGLISRTRDRRHQRSILVTLTREGKACAQKCRQLSARHEKILLDGLSDQQRAELKDALDHVYGNIMRAMGTASNAD